MTISRRVMGWLCGNIWLKLLSLGLALLLWMVVSGEATVERGLRIPLELTQVPATVELLGDAIRLASRASWPATPACRRASVR